MIKEEWEKLRKEEEIPLFLFYEYYKDFRGNLVVMSIEEFEIAFPQFMQITLGGVIITKNGLKYVNFDNIIQKVYKYFDEKFGI